MKKIVFISFSVILALSVVFMASACSGSNERYKDVAGTYYYYWVDRENGGLGPDKDSYFTLSSNGKCIYDLAFLKYEGIVAAEDPTDGECSYEINGDNIKVKVDLYEKYHKDTYIGNGFIRLREYYFCKDGVLPYEVYNGVKYARYSENSYIAFGAEASGDIIIESSYNNLPVINVATRSFYKKNDVTSVTLAEGIKSVDNAFGYNSSIEKVVLPSSVTNIAPGAFDHCTSLKDVSLGSIDKVSDGLFMGCSALESVTIPSTAASIEACAFVNCSELKKVYVPTSVKYLGNQVFGYCDKLEVIYSGTKAQWNEIQKEDIWNRDFSGKITCTDGVVEI